MTKTTHKTSMKLYPISDVDRINKAIRVVHSAGGGSVYLTEGKYRIDGKLELFSDVKLQGDTGKVIMLRGNNYELTTVDCDERCDHA